MKQPDKVGIWIWKVSDGKEGFFRYICRVRSLIEDIPFGTAVIDGYGYSLENLDHGDFEEWLHHDPNTKNIISGFALTNDLISSDYFTTKPSIKNERK